MRKKGKIMEYGPEAILNHLRETDGAYAVTELAEIVGIAPAGIYDILHYLEVTGKIERRVLKSRFYFLKDKYTEAEIKNIMEEGYLRKYNVKRGKLR